MRYEKVNIIIDDSVWGKHSLYRGFIVSLKQFGLIDSLKGIVAYLWRQILYITYPIFIKILFDNKKQFIYKKRKYNYCLEKYNLSFRNERALEIPIIQKLIKENYKLNILEVGCVLKHYKSSPKKKWTIIDKYEKFENVINEDITKYKPEKKFDLIISVSTIEHIGMEDGVVAPDKAKYAIDYIMNNCLNNNGRFVFTIPIGFNKYLDKQIFNNKISISEKHYFTKVSSKEWLEVTRDQVLDSTYNKPYIGANALFIGIINN